MNTSQKDKQQQRYKATYAELLAVVNANRLGFELSLKACIAVAATIVQQEHAAAPLGINEQLLVATMAQFLVKSGEVPMRLIWDAKADSDVKPRHTN